MSRLFFRGKRRPSLDFHGKQLGNIPLQYGLILRARRSCDKGCGIRFRALKTFNVLYKSSGAIVGPPTTESPPAYRTDPTPAGSADGSADVTRRELPSGSHTLLRGYPPSR